MRKPTRILPLIGFYSVVSIASAQDGGLWTSASELADKSMSGPGWEVMKRAADGVRWYEAAVSDQDSDNNVDILAAGIVFARTGEESYRNKVASACEKLASEGYPVASAGKENRTLAWARETGAYALAADLVGYRTEAFETWLRDMAENFVAEDNRTLLGMFHERPNNWGSHAFGSLVAIYAYLQDTTSLEDVRDYWIRSVNGPKPGPLEYGGPSQDLSWHADDSDLRLINPRGAVKEGLDIDGITPDDMRRNGNFSNPPPEAKTSYHWGVLQGMVLAGRVFDRLGMSIWAVGDSAIHRAYTVLQIRWQNRFGGWKAEGDDLWMLPFLDAVYGTDCAVGQPERMWEHGKNAGWPYVIQSPQAKIDPRGSMDTPRSFRLYPNYPNPFNPETRIEYELTEPTLLRLTVFDILGRRIATLFDGYEKPGRYWTVWEAMGDDGAALPGGLYFCCVSTHAGSATIKMECLR